MWRLLLETILAQYRIKPLLKTRSVRHSGGIDQKNAHKISFNYARDHPVLKGVITNGLEKKIYQMIVANYYAFMSVLYTHTRTHMHTYIHT